MFAHACPLPRTQALAFPVLYPFGTNHWGTTRDGQLTITMYFRARVMSSDRRFQVCELGRCLNAG